MMRNLYDNMYFIFSDLRWQDLVDLLLVWFVVYRILLLTKKTGAVQILSGLGILAIFYLTSIWFQIITFNWLLEKFFANLFLIVVILFQGEIRRALAQIGSNPFFSGTSRIQESHLIEELAKGVVLLAQRGYGALIVVEKEIGLDYFIEVGTELDAALTSELLASVFHPSSPLHDGALIIRNGRAFAAGCFLPLTKNPIIDKNLGTRHRAAIGLTEETDAFVLVVSEENRSVGIVQAGQLTPDVDMVRVRAALYDLYGMSHGS